MKVRAPKFDNESQLDLSSDEMAQNAKLQMQQGDSANLIPAGLPLPSSFFAGYKHFYFPG
jgi:hypothetical protein